MRKLSLLLAVVLVLSVALVGCGDSGKSGGDGDTPTITIGVFEPLTGENGGGGKQEVAGMEYANSIRPTVNVGGTEYQVVLKTADNQSVKEQAANAANSLVDSGAVVILGSYGSGVSIAAGDIFKEAQIPAIGASCTNPQVTEGNDYYFRVCFLDPFQGTVMANYAYQNGAKTAAVITQLGDDYSTGLGNFFKSAFTQLGGTVAVEQTFQQNQADFNAILQNVKAADVDVIFAPSSITTAPLLIKQARALDIQATIMAGDTWENSTIIENAGTDAEGVVLSTFFDAGLADSSEVCKNFVEGFSSIDPLIPAVSALGYDAYMVALDAIERAGSLEGPAIRNALAETKDFEGVTGTISFDENGDANKDMAVVKTVKDGKFQFLQKVTIGE